MSDEIPLALLRELYERALAEEKVWKTEWEEEK